MTEPETTPPPPAPTAVSRSWIDHRSCPVCGSRVTTELWSIISRPERRQLWARAHHGTLHLSRCDSGHEGVVRAPLVLFDPATGVAFHSASPGESPDRVAVDRDMLFEILLDAVGSTGRASVTEVVDVPREVLPLVLAAPGANVADFAPGVTVTPAVEQFYAEMSLKSLESALTADGLEPGLVAAVEYELALLFRTRSGDLADPGDRSIELLHRALRFYDRVSFPDRWAAVQSELAAAYRSRARGDRASNVHESIRREQLALEIFTADRHPEDFASSQINLANALLDLGDPSPGTVARAIDAYQAALVVFSPLSYPQSRALAQTNLASVLYERAGGDDLAVAADMLEQALDTRTDEQGPFQLSTRQMTQGLVLRSRSKQAGDQDWLQAVASLRRAHEVLGAVASAAEHIAAARNLADTLMHSTERGDLEESIVLLRRVRGLLLDAGDRTAADNCTRDMAHTWLQLIQATPTPRERCDLARLSIDLFDQEVDFGIVGVVHHQASLEFLQADSLPADERRALARGAVKRALVILRFKQDAEHRVKALVQLGKIDEQGYRAGRSEDGAAARAALEAARTIALTLDDGPGRNEILGRVLMMLTALDVPDLQAGSGSRGPTPGAGPRGAAASPQAR